MKTLSALLAAAAFLFPANAFPQNEPPGKCSWEDAGQEPGGGHAFRFVCPINGDEVSGQRHVEIRCGLLAEEGKTTIYAAWKYEVPARRREDFYAVYTVILSDEETPAYEGYRLSGAPHNPRKKDEISEEEAMEAVFFYNQFGLCLGDISLTDFPEVREAVKTIQYEDEKYRHRQ